MLLEGEAGTGIRAAESGVEMAGISPESTVDLQGDSVLRIPSPHMFLSGPGYDPSSSSGTTLPTSAPTAVGARPEPSSVGAGGGR